MQQDGCWAEASYADVIEGRVVSIDVDLANEHLCDRLRRRTPSQSVWAMLAAAAVVGVALIYNVPALVDHSALAPLRGEGPGRRSCST